MPSSVINSLLQAQLQQGKQASIALPQSGDPKQQTTAGNVRNQKRQFCLNRTDQHEQINTRHEKMTTRSNFERHRKAPIPTSDLEKNSGPHRHKRAESPLA